MEKKLERLVLRPIVETDREQMYSLLTDGQIKKTYMLPDFENTEAVEKLFQRFVVLSNQPDRYLAGMDLNGKLIGFLNDVEVKNGKIELGYVVSPAHWGKGYCTEALKGAMEWLFANGFREVICGAFDENKASLRVMEKAGMEKHPLEEPIEYRGKVHNCLYYAKRK